MSRRQLMTFCVFFALTLVAGCRFIILGGDTDPADQSRAQQAPRLKHESCEHMLPGALPALPDVNRDATGRPLFDSWRDLDCAELDVASCDPSSSGTCGMCFRGRQGEGGFCSMMDIDIWCDGEGEIIGYGDGQCWMCAAVAGHARACCDALPGFDCRAWPFKHSSAPGMVCAGHEDCEAGLICGSGGGSGYGICQCPGVESPQQPELCSQLLY